MMNSIEKTYLIGALREMQQQYKLPDFLNSLQQTGKIDDVELLSQEVLRILDADLYQYEHNLDYYCCLFDFNLTLQLFLRNDQAIESAQQFLEKKINSFNLSPHTESNYQKWGKYFAFFTPAVNRILRRLPIESYEDQLENIDWAELDGAIVHKFSTLIGYTYFLEDSDELRSRSKFWFEKAISKASPNIRVVLNGFVMLYLLETSSNFASQQKKFAALIEQIQGLGSTSDIRDLVLDLNARLRRIQIRQPELASEREALFYDLQDELFAHIKSLEGKDLLSEAYFSGQLARVLIDTSSNDPDEPRMIEPLKSLNKGIENILSRPKIDPATRVGLLIVRAEILSNIDRPKDASELYKEAAAQYKKQGDLIAYAQYVIASISTSSMDEKKQYDLVAEVVKYALKRLDQGGFAAIVIALRYLNTLFMKETDKPGVSWMVAQLDGFFALITQLHNSFENNLQHVGASTFNEYKKEYIRFKPVSHFNIKVYFQYQFQEIRLLELTSLANQDETTLQIARNLLAELVHPNNPLNFIQANWSEFRHVPHSVRNKVLNKCINISKGDLPLAAEHLDFSYRNLRSYITYNEVHRLGFFLDEQDTSMRKLETGIRLLLHDLYENGKIFEVVFDMPRFLIQYSTKGFYAEDMQTILKIKYNTAKKYLKIMTEIGVIEHDKSGGRKNFFTISRDRIMNRYIEEKERENAAQQAVEA